MKRGERIRKRRDLAWQRWDKHCKVTGQWTQLRKSADWFLLWDGAYTRETHNNLSTLERSFYGVVNKVVNEA